MRYRVACLLLHFGAANLTLDRGAVVEFDGQILKRLGRVVCDSDRQPISPTLVQSAVDGGSLVPVRRTGANNP